MTRAPRSFRFLIAALAFAAASLLVAGCDAAGGGVDSKPRTLTVQISPTTAAGSEATGTVRITTAAEDTDVLTISGTLEGLAEGDHGMHLHANPDCSAEDANGDGQAEPAGAAGPHYNPDDSGHGAPADAPGERHFGDFGNVTAGPDGTASFEKRVARPEGVVSNRDLMGRALVVHGSRDDLQTDPGGGSGMRVGCGVL